MFERYTERARRVILFARFEAVQFGSTTIETEHLLLALIREDENLTNRFLRNHCSIQSIRNEIERRTTIREKVSSDIALPMSGECKRILIYASEEAERLNQLHIGTEHVLLGILRDETCLAAEILQQVGLRLNAIREELARTPMPVERRVTFLADEMAPLSSLDPRELPKSGVVPDADTAKRIAEAAWKRRYGADTVASQVPIQAELKFDVWIVTGSSSAEVPLYAFISQKNGLILVAGQWLPNS